MESSFTVKVKLKFGYSLSLLDSLYMSGELSEINGPKMFNSILQ
jgi:hypothetical protein